MEVLNRTQIIKLEIMELAVESNWIGWEGGKEERSGEVWCGGRGNRNYPPDFLKRREKDAVSKKMSSFAFLL